MNAVEPRDKHVRQALGVDLFLKIQQVCICLPKSTEFY